MRSGGRGGPRPGRPAGSVRVVAGRFRGRRLAVPPGLDIRPTADRVKEALFSILGPRIPGAAVVDAFAGTGALGIEALSRGAASVVFLERDPRSLAVLRANLERLGGPPAAVVLAADALQPAAWAGRAFPADLILADPPYRGGLATRFLAVLRPEAALAGGGCVAVEHAAEEEPEHPAWRRMDHRRYGDTAVSLYVPAGPESAA